MKKAIDKYSVSSISYFALFIALLTFVFRSLINGISTHLLSWYDYPLSVWLIFPFIEKIKSVNFFPLFGSNIFYPSSFSLLFTDLNIPQAAVAFPLTFASNNPILIFNIVFLATFMLNYVSLYLFWKYLFNNKLTAFLGSIFFIFSPFLHTQIGHFQMFSYWPFFSTAYLLLTGIDKKSIKRIFFASIFFLIQFLSSIYITAFLMPFVLLLCAIKFINVRKTYIIKYSLLFFVTSGILILPVVRQYLLVQDYYSVVKEIKPAHVSDYLFTAKIKTILYQAKPILRWNSFNQFRMSEKAAFPGFLLTLLAIFGAFKLRRSKYKTLISIELLWLDWLFLLIGVLGFWLSISPRLFVNGQYIFIPTGYNIIIKYLPFLSVIRAGARWSFLVYLSVIYFSLKGVKKALKSRKRKLAITIITIWFFVEFIPINLQTHAEQYLAPGHNTLRQLCIKNKKVVLEYPVTHYNVEGGIIQGLQYISKVVMASLYHKCNLVNGYSGYDPPYLRSLHAQITDDLSLRRFNELDRLLKKYDIDIVKVNTKYINKKHLNTILWREYKNRKASPTIIIDN